MIAPNMISAFRARPAISRAARSTAATCSKRRARAIIRCLALIKAQADNLFETGTRKLGYHPFPTPRAILSQPYKGRPACTNCGFCQTFGCHVGAKSSILVTKLPEADASGNFKLLTGTMVYRVNSDNSGRATGVSYYGPDGSENTIEADLVILTPYIYDNTRLLLLSKTDKFPNGLANSSGLVGKGMMTHPARASLPCSTTDIPTSSWGRATRNTASTISTPTISITPVWASSAARRFPSRVRHWTLARSACR